MAATPPSPAATGRLEFVDLLRGWAVIVMIETHVVNATVRPEILESGPFHFVKFLNGLVAPSFIFASGLAFAVTARRKLPQYIAGGPVLRKQVLRLLLILAVGYVLHIPKFNLGQLLHETTPGEWQVFFMADVLHCIAVSLLAVLGLAVLLKDERRLFRAVAAAAGIVLLATPPMWSIDWWEVLPWPIAAYLNGVRHSLFPLFPWAFFLFAGVLVGFVFLRARDGRPAESGPAAERALMQSLFWVAPGVIALSFAVEPIAAAIYPVYDYWRFSPSFVLLRLGLVLLLCGAMYAAEHVRGVSPRSAVTLLGRESLLVYVAHLLLIYGDFGTFNARRAVDQSFGIVEALLSTLLLLVVMTALAFFWSRLKARSPRLRKGVSIGFALLLLGIFLFGPGQ
jgi:uncharacterized membrane protein